MKVNLISGLDPKIDRASGIKSYVLSLARELVARGHEIRILCLGSKADNLEGIELIPIAESIRNSGDFNFALRRYLKRDRKIKGILHAQRPDNLIPFHLKTPKLPSVVTLHGIHSIHIRARRGWTTALFYRTAERYSLFRTDAIINVSKDTHDYFCDRYPKLISRMHLIPAGIDLNLCRPEDKAEARRRIDAQIEGRLALFIGRFEPEKNPQLILNKFLSIKRQHPDANLIMIGNGRLENKLRDSASRNENSVRVLNPVPQSELIWFLNAADILVIASSHEGLPTVALEALACGIPVVGTRVGILPEIIKQGSNGYLFDDPNSIGPIMEKALFNTKWNVACCRDSIKRFGWNKTIQSILDVYRSIST